MKTLMRNGRDRRSENPFLGHARKERVSLFGTDQRITSGPAATRLHSKAEYMTAPERFADSQIPLAPRAPSIHDPMLHHLQRCPRSVQIQFSWLATPRTTGGRNDRYCRLRVTLSRWYARAKRASAGDLSAHRGGAGAIRSDIGPTPMSLATGSEPERAPS